MRIVQTDRLVLRPPRPADLQAFLAYRNHPGNLHLQPIAPMSDQDAARFLLGQSTLGADADDCWIMYAIERLDDGALIGEVGIYIEAARTGTGDIGWSLHPAHHGKGHATAAARLLLDHVFGERGLQRVTASMSAQNAPSIRLCERLGMRRATVTPGAQRVGDAWHDAYQYQLLASEWHASHLAPTIGE